MIAPKQTPEELGLELSRLYEQISQLKEKIEIFSQQKSALEQKNIALNKEIKRLENIVFNNEDTALEHFNNSLNQMDMDKEYNFLKAKYDEIEESNRTLKKHVASLNYSLEDSKKELIDLKEKIWKLINKYILEEIEDKYF